MRQLHTNRQWNWVAQQQYYTHPTKQHRQPAWQRAIHLEFYKPFLDYTYLSKRTTYVSGGQTTVKPSHNQVVSFAQRIEEIRSVLAISVTDLAAILDVTRPTIYTFMDGKEPVEDSETKYARIQTLQLLAKKIEESDLALPCNQILRRRNQQGESLKELIGRGAATKTDLDAFVATEVEQQRKNKQRAALIKESGAAQRQKGPESISAPYHQE